MTRIHNVLTEADTAPLVHQGLIDTIDGVRDPVKLDEGELGRPEGWPPSLWVLKYSTGHHGMICHQGIHGLVCFKKRANCLDYATFVKNPPSRAWLSKLLTFEEARNLAKEKAELTKDTPKPVRALVLADAGPLVHYVA